MACLVGALTGQTVIVDNLLPEMYRRPEGQSYDRHSSERRQFTEAIGKVLPIYAIRARAITSRVEIAAIEGEITSSLSQRRTESEHRWFRRDYRYSVWARRACDALVRCDGNAAAIISMIGDVGQAMLRDAAPGLWIDLAELLISRDSYRSLAYDLLTRAAEHVTTRPTPGSERWHALLRCASVASPYDDQLGREYYEQGLAAAEGIDDDTAYLLSFQASTATGAASGLGDERHELIARMVRLIELQESYVSDRSVLPHAQLLETVGRLNPPSAFPLCCRWDDENRYMLTEAIPHVVRPALDTTFLTPLQALSLLRLAGEEHDISIEAVLVLQRLNEGGPAARPELLRALKSVVEWIQRDMPLSARCGAAKRIIDWADESRLGTLAGISELRSLLAFAGAFGLDTRAERLVEYGPTNDDDEKVGELIQGAETAPLSELGDTLREIWRRSYGGKQIIAYVRRLARAIPTSRRVALLEALVAAVQDEVLVR